MFWRRRNRPERRPIEGPATRIPDNDVVFAEQGDRRRAAALLRERTELLPTVDPPVVPRYCRDIHGGEGRP
jgi:hypothetical protein